MSSLFYYVYIVLISDATDFPLIFKIEYSQLLGMATIFLAVAKDRSIQLTLVLRCGIHGACVVSFAAGASSIAGYYECSKNILLCGAD